MRKIYLILLVLFLSVSTWAANTVGSVPYKIDTVMSSSFSATTGAAPGKGPYQIAFLYWAAPTSAGHKFTLVDQNSTTVATFTATAATVSQGYYVFTFTPSKIVKDFRVTAIDSGTLYIYTGSSAGSGHELPKGCSPNGTNGITCTGAGTFGSVSASNVTVGTTVQLGADYTGQDFGAVLASCITTVGSAGGTCDGRGARNATISSDATISTKYVTVLLPRTLTLNAKLYVLNDYVRLGSDNYGSAVKVGMNGGIAVGDASHNVYQFNMDNLTLSPDTAATPAYGLRLQNAREGKVSHVDFWQFAATGAAAINVVGGSWTWTWESVTVTQNYDGFRFDGAGGTNAWTLIKPHVTSNTHAGFYLTEPSGTSGGLSMIDPQLERNGTDILVDKGTYNQIELLGGYGEANATERFVSISGSTVQNLNIVGGTYWADGGVPLVDLDTTSSGAIKSTISSVFVDGHNYANNLPSHAVFRAVGASTILKVNDSTQKDGTNKYLPYIDTDGLASVTQAGLDATGRYTLQMNGVTRIFASATSTQSTMVNSGSTAGVYFNQAANSGTGGIIPCTGGASPVCGQAIKAVFQKSAAVDPPSINANSTSDITVSWAGLVAGDVCYANPGSALESGLVIAGYRTTTDSLIVRVANITASPIDGINRTWYFECLRN